MRAARQRQHTCFPTLPGMRDRTILLGGFSKSHAMTGWRIGYAAAPKEISAAMRKIHQYTIMSAPTMAQVAGCRSDGAGRGLRRRDAAGIRSAAALDRERLQQLRHEARLSRRARSMRSPSVTISGMNEDEFANRLLQEEHVAVVPGTAFGAGGAGYVRCSYATAYEKIEEALRRMERFVRRHG